MKDKKGNKDFSKVIKFMKKKAPVYFTFMIMNNAIVSICYNIVLALILKDVVDAISYHNIILIRRAFLLAIISFIIAFIFEPITMKIMNYCVRSTMEKVRQDTFDHMEEIKVNIYEKSSSGDTISRLTKDVDALEDIFLYQIPSLCFSIIHGGIAIFLMIYMSPLLGSIAILLGLFSVFVNFVISKRIKIHSENHQKEAGILSQSIIDLQDGFIDIKMSCNEDYFYNKFKRTSKKTQHYYEKREKYSNLLDTTNILIDHLNSIGLMALGLFIAYKGHTTIGVVISVIRLQGNASYLFQNLSSFIGGLQKALPSARRVLEIFEMDTEKCNDNCIFEKYDIKQCEEHIILKDIVFSYDGLNNVLDGISMSINHGEFVGIFGESGKGKSTFMKILLGFYPPTSGVYMINGKQIEDINIVELRNQIAYVDQDCFLFQQSIEENVRLGNQNATKEEIIKACKLANAHEFIINLEGGYNTIINETGDNISGGQRQRIAIARSLVSNREILLIDEGTSELDLETEKIIFNTIMSLKGKKTIIIISHKSSIIENADKKYRFVEGKIG